MTVNFDAPHVEHLEGGVETTREVKHVRIYTREAMEAVDFNSKQAVDFLIHLAESDGDLRVMLLKLGAEQAVRSYFHQERKAPVAPTVKLPTVENPVEAAERVERQEEKVRRRLFWDRYALFGHMQLKVAKRPDLRSSINNRKKQIAGNQRCVDFESDIMGRLSNDKTRVEQQLKIAEVIEIARTHDVL